MSWLSMLIGFLGITAMLCWLYFHLKKDSTKKLQPTYELLGEDIGEDFAKKLRETMLNRTAFFLDPKGMKPYNPDQPPPKDETGIYDYLQDIYLPWRQEYIQKFKINYIVIIIALVLVTLLPVFLIGWVMLPLILWLGIIFGIMYVGYAAVQTEYAILQKLADKIKTGRE